MMNKIIKSSVISFERFKPLCNKINTIFAQANTVAMWCFIGPSEWQPGGRRTLFIGFFRHLLPLHVGLIKMAGLFVKHFP